MKLSALIEAVKPLSIQNTADPEITSVHYRAQDVRPGGLFVAITGHAADGHDFINAAIKKGATAVVSQRKSTTTRTAGGLDFPAKRGKRQGREVPQSLRVKPGAKHPVWKTQLSSWVSSIISTYGLPSLTLRASGGAPNSNCDGCSASSSISWFRF